MGKLVGLEGVSRDIDALFIYKGSDIEVILNNDYAATDAQQNGAINIYKDDEGKIRCEAMAHFRSLEHKIFDTIEEAIVWTDEWLVKIK